MGDTSSPVANTVQVDPQPFEVKGPVRALKVRVSRSGGRISSDGVPYRSYVSIVQFDCTRRNARYREVDYYMAPLWQGEPHQHRDYSGGEPQYLKFQGVEPNPTQRLVNAVCGAGSAIR